jgi:hypothetical protein
MSRYIKAFDEIHIINVVSAYLYEGLSHRQIQREILGLPAPPRGGGFIAMDLLHYFGIDGSKKSILKSVNIIDEINNSDGNYREVLQKVHSLKQSESGVIEKIRNKTYTIFDPGTELLTQTKIRINQSILRRIVLHNYNYACALCELDKQDLLICSHIKPWAIDSENRLNPSNAICLCALHDSLFDKGYFSLDGNYQLIFGPKADTMIKNLLRGKRFKLPTDSPPDTGFLEYHFTEICN